MTVTSRAISKAVALYTPNSSTCSMTIDQKKTFDKYAVSCSAPKRGGAPGPVQTRGPDTKRVENAASFSGPEGELNGFPEGYSRAPKPRAEAVRKRDTVLPLREGAAETSAAAYLRLRKSCKL